MPTTFDYLHCRCNYWEIKHKAMTNADKFREVFDMSPKNVCDADNNEWWDEEYAPLDHNIQHVSYDDAQLGREK